MRFAYIDSNGNEVPIPSVDALALRIELGAINERTELYDAQADQWGPAHTHEIYHTLARAAEGGDGFVAPPPPVPPPTTEPSDPPAAPAKPPRPESGSPGATDDAIAGLTLADAPSEPPESPGAGHEKNFGLELAPPQPVEDEPTADEEGPAFDFGDLGGGLEMEGGVDDGEPAMDFASGTGFGGGLERGLEFDTTDASPPSGGLDLEQPMSEFRPEDPPSWMDPPEEESPDDAMDFSAISSDVATAEEDPLVSPRSRRKSKGHPSPPRFRSQRSLVAPIVGVVVLAALAVGAYVAWPIAIAEWQARTAPPPPEATLPGIPDRLQSAYRAAADLAFASTFRAARGRVSGDIGAPPQEWLGGVYLANASRYPTAETFWLGIRDQLEAVREVDADAFVAAFESSMTSAGIPAADRPEMLERARAGFSSSAASAARAHTFRLVDDIVDAALDLHAFLVANEASIEYAPASTVTSDPVLEARPATPRIGAAMADRIGDVTDALDELDYLDLVTGEGLWSAVLRRVQDVGVR